jgi:uncharacterized protein (UPF0332 family)
MKPRDTNLATLIRYRMEQAHAAIEEVDRLIEIHLLHVAVNRVYYGMFYALSALALTYGFESNRHQQLMGWFNKNFIKTGILEVKYGQIIRSAYKNRAEGDYAAFIEFSDKDVKRMQAEMVDFINRLEDLTHHPDE